MLRSVLYVSTSTLRLPQEAKKVDEIVTFSLSFNARAGITGALMFTERNFAQFLEGPDVEVTALLERINRDARHRDVTVMSDEAAEARLFPDWGMAYLGPHLFVERQFQALVDASGEEPRRRAARNLTDLMVAFTQEWQRYSQNL